MPPTCNYTNKQINCLPVVSRFTPVTLTLSHEEYMHTLLTWQKFFFFFSNKAQQALYLHALQLSFPTLLPTPTGRWQSNGRPSTVSVFVVFSSTSAAVPWSPLATADGLALVRARQSIGRSSDMTAFRPSLLISMTSRLAKRRKLTATMTPSLTSTPNTNIDWQHTTTTVTRLDTAPKRRSLFEVVLHSK